jgi:DNA helicase HerA-like ATPase
VRLIRSKGVGVFFVTQTPKDVPSEVLAQLGNRVQHALRAFTPDDAKALKATVSTFPSSDVYELGDLLTQMGIGEAVVTILSEKGAPTPIAWTRLRPPESLMAQLDPEKQKSIVAASPLLAEYGQVIDRESAYEKLLAKVAPPAEEAPPVAQEQEQAPEKGHAGAAAAGGVLAGVLGSSVFRSFARSAASAAGREISRSIFGTAKRRRTTTRRRR